MELPFSALPRIHFVGHAEPVLRFAEGSWPRRADTTESAAESQDRTNRTKNHKRPPSGGFDSREKRSLFIKAESDETPQCSVCGNQTPPNPLPVGSFWKPSPTEPSLRDAAVVCGKRAEFVPTAQLCLRLVPAVVNPSLQTISDSPSSNFKERAHSQHFVCSS